MREDTRWLEPAEAQAWRGWINSTATISRLIEGDLKRDSGLSIDDYEVLVHLSEAPERRMRMTELGQAVVHSPSRLSQRMDRLTQRGLVARERASHDRRGVMAVLTDAGFMSLSAAVPGHVASVRRHMLDHLTGAEIESLAATLPRLAEAAKAGDG